jgi:hypothetical protein
MNPKFSTILRWVPPAAAAILIATFFLALIPGCDTENPAELTIDLKPDAELVHSTGCKSFASTSGSEAVAQQDCFTYRLAEGNVLLLTHVNAGFNCCPGDITAGISIANDTITIVEHESESACRCLCLYDLDYRFENIQAGTYTIRFVEPYRPDADDPLQATIDLAAAPSGTCCVERTAYPWDNGGASAPYGELTTYIGCLESPPNDELETEPGDLSCAAWILESNGILYLSHVNAAFYCWSTKITADIRIDGDTITIAEHDVEKPGTCRCLYLLNFEIRNLEPGTYLIRFIEPYVSPDDERLEFTVDLVEQPVGAACAYRAHYPWRYDSSFEGDSGRLGLMRREIVDLIGTPYCGGDGECRAIGLGVKPCGGPSEYLVYSTSTVDRLELLRLVSKYNVFNYGINRRYNLASDCMVVTPPAVGCVDGVCGAIDESR